MFNLKHFNNVLSKYPIGCKVYSEKMTPLATFFNSFPDIITMTTWHGDYTHRKLNNIILMFAVLPSGFERLQWFYLDLCEHLLPGSIEKRKRINVLLKSLREVEYLDHDERFDIYDSRSRTIMPDVYSDPHGISLSIKSSVVRVDGVSELTNRVKLNICLYTESDYNIAHRVLLQTIEKYKLLHF